MMTTKKHDTTHSTTCDTVRGTTCDTVRGTTCDTVRDTTCGTVRGRDAKFCVSTNPIAEPELRFPEFHDEWQVKHLGEIAVFYKGKGISKSEASLQGKTPCVRYGELYTYYNEIITETKSFTNIQTDNLFLSKKNDIIIPSSGETKEDISTASCVMKNGIALGGDINIIRTNNDGIFFAYYLNNAKKYDIAKIAQGISIIHLYNEQLKNLYVCFPTLPEQRKIALCLSSLDDLIKSVGDKIELLKQHKKGLMQKLFPKKDGTICGRGHGRDAKFCVSTNPTIVPELRFPEFSGDWQVKRLGDVAEIVSEKENNSIENYVSTENLLPNYGGVVYDAKIPSTNSLTKYKFGDILLSNIRPYLKKIWQANVNGTASNDVVVFRVSNTFDDSFICFVLKNDRFIDYVMASAKGVKMPRGDKNMMLNYAVSFPSLAEQRKIATCLSSIDTAIEDTEKKLQMLEQHKKGLMQRMFVRRV